MEVWRLTPLEYSDEPLSGEGSSLYGGRWNPKGLQVVYTASTLSLAFLELLVQTGTRTLPRRLRAIQIGIPDDCAVETLDVDELPSDWREVPPPQTLRDLGADWISRSDSVVLSVPSAVLPVEYNHLLNPQHPDFGKISVVSISEPGIDRRLAELF